MRPVNLPIFPGTATLQEVSALLGVADAPYCWSSSGWFLVLHESKRVHLNCGDLNPGYCARTRSERQIAHRCSFPTCRWIARFRIWHAGRFYLFRIEQAREPSRALCLSMMC